MEITRILVGLIKRNLILFITLITTAVICGFVHSSLQKIQYVSEFTTTGGLVEYTSIQTYNKFDSPDSNYYSMNEARLEEIRSLFEDFTINFVQNKAKSISFTVMSLEMDANHLGVQNAVLELMNNNKMLDELLARKKALTRKKVEFLKNKIQQLDSLTGNQMYPPVNNSPLDSYALFSEMIELEDQLNNTGVFEVLLNMSEPISQKRPLIMFIGLYLVNNRLKK